MNQLYQYTRLFDEEVDLRATMKDCRLRTLTLYADQKQIQSVLDRLQNNRVWKDLNEMEKNFSIDYVDKLNKNMEKPLP